MVSKLFRSLFIFCLSIIFGVVIMTSVVLMVPFLICRLLVSYLSILRPDLDRMLGLRDNYFICKNFWKSSKLALISKANTKGRMRAHYVKEQFIKKIFDKELNMRPRKEFSVLQQYPYSWMGYYFWKWEEKFNINDHIFEYTCKKLEDNPKYIFSKGELKEIEDEIYLKPFTKNKSLWDITLVPTGVSDSGDEQTVVYFRTGHSMGDGYAVLMLWAELFGGQKTVKQIEAYKKLGIISWKLKFAILIKTIVFGLYDLAESLIKVDKRNAWKILYPKNSDKLVYFESKLIPMETVKEIAKIHNVGVTAIIYSAATSGLRRALMKNNGAVPQSMCSIIPLQICGRPNRLANHTAMDTIRLPVGESDSVKRLKLIHDDICRVKKSTFQFISFYIYSVFLAPFSFITEYYSDPRYSPRSVIITSMPTFKFKCGVDYEIQSFSYAGTVGMVSINNPIGFTILSYANNVRFVVQGHNAVFTSQNLEDITNFIEKELEKLKSIKL